MPWATDDGRRLMSQRRAALFTSAIFALLAAACSGQSAPTAPATTSALLERASVSEANAAPTTTTWSCFTASRAGAFGPSGCASAVVIGAERFHPLAGTPSTPTGLQGTVTGTTVTLTWSYVSGANPDATSYVIEAGSASGLSDIASFDT